MAVRRRSRGVRRERPVGAAYEAVAPTFTIRGAWSSPTCFDVFFFFVCTSSFELQWFCGQKIC